MSILRVALAGALAVALVIVLAVVYFALTFDPRDHLPRLSALIEERTGRTLRVSGEIALSFWPDLGVRVGGVSLSERGGDAPFADVERARVTLKLRPLLSREVVAEGLVVSGAHVRVTRYADGRYNVDDLLNKEGGAFEFDIARLVIERSSATYEDRATGRRLELSDIALETGRLRRGATTEVKLGLRAREGADAYDVRGSLSGRIAVDPLGARHGMRDASLEVRGRTARLGEIALRLAAVEVELRQKAGEMLAHGVTAALKSAAGDEPLEALLKVDRVTAAAGTVVLDTVAGDVRASGAGTTTVRATAPRVALDADRAQAPSVALDIRARRGEGTLEASIATPLEARIDERTVSLPGLDARLAVAGRTLPGGRLSARVAGDVRVDLDAEQVRLALSGTVAESRVKAKLQSAGFVSPVYSFEVHIDRLNLDRYAGTHVRGRAGSPVDLSPLASLPASGTVRIDVLTASSMRARDVELVIAP